MKKNSSLSEAIDFFEFIRHEKKMSALQLRIEILARAPKEYKLAKSTELHPVLREPYRSLLDKYINELAMVQKFNSDFGGK